MKRKWLCGLLAAVMLMGVLSGLPLRTNAVANMTSSQAMIDVLKKMEGFAKYPYWDNSQYSVGYGTRCPSDKLEEYLANGIPEADAEYLLRKMLTDFENEVKAFAKKYGLTFTQNEFDALVSLTYNCGGGWTYDSKSALATALRSGATGSDLIHAMSLYSKSHRDYVLIQRRLSEAAMYLEGIYEAYNRNEDGTYPSTYRYVFLDGNGGESKYVIHGYDGADPKGINTIFSLIPTGVDAEGNSFVYTFAGWYTASVGGTKVEVLDASLPNGTVLYAQWADPTGQIVSLPRGQVVDNLKITNSQKIKIHSGPGSYYPQLGNLAVGSTVTITEVHDYNNGMWGKYEGGWISLSYTDYEEVLASQDNVWPKTGTVTGDNVNVRNNPGTSGTEIQYKLNKGAAVVISQTYDDGSLKWGQLEDGNWICLSYVSFQQGEGGTAATVVGAALLKGPDKTEYVQMQDLLNLQGSVLQLTMSDGTVKAMTLTQSMIKTYSNATLGATTVTAKHEGYEISFPVTIVKATVTFRNEDGAVLGQTQYAYGETVTPPAAPAKPGDEAGEYVFAGWDREVTACYGNATYTAVFKLKETEPPTTEPLPPETTDPSTQPTDPSTQPTEPPEWPKSGTVNAVGVNVRPGPGTATGDPVEKLNSGAAVKIYEIVYDGTQYWWGKLESGNWICMRYVDLEEEWDDSVPGDMDGNWMVNKDDAIYLLRHVVFPSKYEMGVSGDVNNDGVVDKDDAIYLLRHVVFPNKYPLNN